MSDDASDMVIAYFIISTHPLWRSVREKDLTVLKKSLIGSLICLTFRRDKNFSIVIASGIYRNPSYLFVILDF